MEQLKVCKICGQELPLSEFNFMKRKKYKPYLIGRCKTCHKGEMNRRYFELYRGYRGIVAPKYAQTETGRRCGKCVHVGLQRGTFFRKQTYIGIHRCKRLNREVYADQAACEDFETGYYNMQIFN